ncbi:MAG: type I restriction-modification system subunit M [bacterium]|nr:type I restriction-modification system subunit M [bacterium]
MTDMQFFVEQTKALVDKLKSICGIYGLGNDGNEYKIIVQIFLYKFLNDKFAYEIKELEPRLRNAEKWEDEIKKYSDEEYKKLLYRINESSAQLQREHYISHLFNNQNNPEFAKLLDDTLIDIAVKNNDIFAVKTAKGEKIQLFETISNYITDVSERDNFARSLINAVVDFSFEKMFTQKFDFFATIFEYLIKDYNKDGGGKYAEYYTPHSVAEIMAKILVGDDDVRNVTCYDPSAGTGSLLMSLAHAIGEDKCAIYSQDISQKSSTMLRLNLILNNLVSSIANIIKGNTLTNPEHKENNQLKKFDYIVSNPPFKLDFSEYRNELTTQTNSTERFFGGIPKIPPKDLDDMAIYLCFLQHILYSLSTEGKAAVVVPTGFLAASKRSNKIAYNIRKKLIDEKWLKGVVSMPSNIFANTGTNVSVLFIDKVCNSEKVLLVDASNLGTTIKEDDKQKTILSVEEENKIIRVFQNKEEIEDFSTHVSFHEIEKKNYSFSAGQYFEIKTEYIDLTQEQFKSKIDEYNENLTKLYSNSHTLEQKIQKQMELICYEQ